MTAITEFYAWIVPEVGGATEAVVLNAVRDALHDFFRDSTIWRSEWVDIAISAPTQTTVSAAATAGATSITVADASGLVSGNTLLIEQYDGTIHRTTIGTPAGLVVPINTAVIKDVSAGAAARKVTERYALPIPSGTIAIEVVEAQLNGQDPVEPIAPGDLNRLYPQWRTRTGKLERHQLFDDGTIQVVRIPDAAGVLSVQLALSLSAAASTIPDWIFNRYSEEIGAGAKVRLMRMPQKPWTNPQLAKYYQDIFDEACDNAKMRAAKGNSRAPLRVVAIHGLPDED